jgi:hypothetical protein
MICENKTSILTFDLIDNVHAEMAAKRIPNYILEGLASQP